MNITEQDRSAGLYTLTIIMLPKLTVRVVSAATGEPVSGAEVAVIALLRLEAVADELGKIISEEAGIVISHVEDSGNVVKPDF